MTCQTYPIVLLEAHNIRNLSYGLGVFNFELLKALSRANTDFRLKINMVDPSLMPFFDSPLVEFHRYNSFQRHSIAWIGTKMNIWHSLSQDLKVEPFHDVNYVLTIHDVINHNNKKYKKRLEEKIRRATAITYISKFAQEDTHRYFNVGSHVKESVIYNGNTITSLLDTSNFQPIEAAKVPFLYAIGDFQERKNFHSLVEMMRVNSDFNLIISGKSENDYARKIRSMIDAYRLNDRVFLTGVVSEMGKQYYMSHASAFLFPSTEEGFGLPIIEAMQFGKPVFLSTLTCMPEIGGADAYYFENFDPEYMNERLISGLHHFSENQESLEQKMKARASQFSWDRAANEYLDVYRDILR